MKKEETTSERSIEITLSEDISEKLLKALFEDDEIKKMLDERIKKADQQMSDAIDGIIKDLKDDIEKALSLKNKEQQKNEIIELVVDFTEALQETNERFSKEEAEDRNNDLFKRIREIIRR